ncbi:MAG TPA: hypothetical protein VIL71_20415 [Spirillospora sp.]
MRLWADFAVSDWPEPRDPGLPFADKSVWPDEACPRCGCPAQDTDLYHVPRSREWKCVACTYTWCTMVIPEMTGERPAPPERRRADALAASAAAAADRRRARGAAAATTEAVRRAALAARAVGVTTRRVCEVAKISPDTPGRWERAHRGRRSAGG